jgi:serine/threonine protein kinase
MSKKIGKYTIEPQMLGKGKHSIVKKAIDHEENEEVAVKIVDLNNPAVPISYQMELNNEVAILSTISHPNIVHLYESIEIDSTRYVFTEYIIGGELLERLKQEKFYSEKKARRVIEALVEAITYLHQNDIVHR